MSNCPNKSDDPNCAGYERCQTCDHPCAVIEFEEGPDRIVHCNHCRPQVKS